MVVLMWVIRGLEVYSGWRKPSLKGQGMDASLASSLRSPHKTNWCCLIPERPVNELMTHLHLRWSHTAGEVVDFTWANPGRLPTEIANLTADPEDHCDLLSALSWNLEPARPPIPGWRGREFSVGWCRSRGWRTAV